MLDTAHALVTSSMSGTRVSAVHRRNANQSKRSKEGTLTASKDRSKSKKTLRRKHPIRVSKGFATLPGILTKSKTMKMRHPGVPYGVWLKYTPGIPGVNGHKIV